MLYHYNKEKSSEFWRCSRLFFDKCRQAIFRKIASYGRTGLMVLKMQDEAVSSQKNISDRPYNFVRLSTEARGK
jgi:hypothetical protein